MVFESVIASVLNTFLGDFIDNLDPSQLNIGVWGGDVKLHNLKVKDTALDGLDLPIKLKFGYLNALIMKIPWKNLYTEPVVVDIEMLHLIIVPNQGVVYDEEKARKRDFQAKQKALNALEENRKAKRKPKEEAADTFTEKLVAQVIKNLQVNIKNIHIRYEDRFSNRNRPFAAGITLENLEFQTADANFQAKIHKEEMKIFYKLVSLNSLSIYWNSSSKLISDLDSKDEMFSALKATIATKNSQPDKYKYVFGPISMNAKLALNQKPEADKFKTPKVDLCIETEELSSCINKLQYQDVLYFLEAQERFNIAARYLKYRPNLTTYRGNYKQWYHFAYNCIVADIRRKRKNWSWQNMKAHRALVKRYREAWLHFRTEKDCGTLHKRTIEEAEEKLDVFNLNIARQQAEMDIDRLELVRTEDQEVQTWAKWAKSWFGASSDPKLKAKHSTGQEIVSQFQEAITPEEKAKLFDAIDYQENIPPTNYPKEFVENKVRINLSRVTIAVDTVIQLRFDHLSADLEQRPAARAICVRSNIKSVTMDGLGYSMLTMLVPETNWLSVEFITNPLDGSFDQFVGLTTAPVLLKYHARAVNAFLDVFRPPKSVRLNQLTTAAFARYEAVKIRSIMGLQYAAEKNSRLKLEIHFSPTTIVVSKGGNYNEDTLNLVAQLGSLDVKTIDEMTNFNFGADVKDQKHKDMLSKAYMKIRLSIADIQLCFAEDYQTCFQAHKDVNSPYHIIKPMRMELNLCKALVEDFQIPRFRVYCELPSMSASISDERLTKLFELLLSVPTPKPSPDDDDDEEGEPIESVNVSALSTAEIRNRAKILAMMETSTELDTGGEVSETEKKKIWENKLQKAADPKKFIYEFRIGEISAMLFSRKLQKTKDVSNEDAPFGALNINKLGVTGHMTEGGYLQCKLSLKTITMDDKRKGTRIQRLLDKKQPSSLEVSHSESDSFVYLFYEQDGKGEKKLNLSSSSFYLLLSPEFLGALSSFVVMPKQEEADAGLHPELTANRTKLSATNPNKSFTAGGGGGGGKKSTGIGSLTMKCRIRKVEVILIEDSFKPDESQALILSFNTFLDAKNVNDIQRIDGSVQDLQITSTYFAMNKREKFSYSVLRRLHIILAGTIDETNKAQDFVISMEKVHVKVSPSVIRLLSAVSTQFSKHQLQNEDDNGDLATPIMKPYPEYWMPRKLKKSQYWWFQNAVEEGQDANALCRTTSNPKNTSNLKNTALYSENAQFTIESFMITVEAGRSDVTVPMILLDSRLKADAKNWTSLLEVDAAMSLQISYYNEAFCVWEPVIEPVQVKDTNGKEHWRSWELILQVRSHGDELVPSTELDDTEKYAQLPKMMVTIDAKELMNVTITKSFLQLTSELAVAFEEAARQITPPKTRTLPGSGAYLVCNETGINVTISNSETLKVSDSIESVNLPHYEFLDLDAVESLEEDASANAGGLFLTYQDRRKSELRMNLLNTRREVNVMRAEKRCLRLPKQPGSLSPWTLLVDTRLENSRHVVFLRSLINFINHTSDEIEIYATVAAKYGANANRLSLCGVAKLSGNPIFIPLQFIYTPTGEFNFSIEGYEQSSESISWHDFDTQQRFIVRCDRTADMSKPTYIEAVVETEDVMDERGKYHAYKLYTVHLYPPLFIHNLLLFPLVIRKPMDVTLKAGEGIALNLIPGLFINFSMLYNEVSYSTTMEIPKKRIDLTAKSLKGEDGSTFLVGLNWSTQNRQMELNVFVRHWMVNNTNKKLRYIDSESSRLHQICYGRTGSNLSQENSAAIHAPGHNPRLLPLCAKNFFDNKKAKLCIVGETDFSNDFPLDTAGNSGRIMCRASNGREYEFSVDVQLCHFGLTRVVTMSPFYLLQNESKFAIEYCEKGSKEWHKIPPKSCVDLWPTQESKRKMMCVRYEGQKESSILFPFTETFESFCKINNDFLGVYITCVVGESSSVICVEPFSPGMVPAILMNATLYPICFRQSSTSDPKQIANDDEVLEPGYLKAFTWSDVTVHERTLRWECGQHEAQDQLLRNNAGTYIPSSSDVRYQWVSFLNGRQRIFLFTKDENVATTALQSYAKERIDLQTEVNFYGVGVSLVNNLEGVEVLYMAMSSSLIVWERLSRSRYCPLAVKAMEECEAAHVKWKENNKPDGFQPTENFEINFSTLEMRRKGRSARNVVKIRRSFQNGLWVQIRQSAHQLQAHVKLNHLQVDNQLPACVFPCVLAVVPPPKSVVADNEPKPFTELSFIMNQSEFSNVVEIKYLHILVQEFAIRVDNGLINAAVDLFSSEAITLKSGFERDLELAKPQLSQRALHTAAIQLKSYYDDLHISPLMIHLSFSQGGYLEKKSKGKNGGSDFLKLILKSFGVTLTELQDIVFKLAYFDRKYVFYNRQELEAEIMSHYRFQFIKQLYVLVFGLDIIGNPYGLVRDLSTGMEDFFYQPFQGAILGPEEFAEGLALGVQSLFGHAVGGAAGAVSRIAGTLGKGVAALTLDEEFQRKRQEGLNRRPQNISEGLTRGAKGVGQGVYDGVTGVFVKPFEGARDGGIIGFASGVGKGLVGVVVRPVSGVVDFASGTLDVLKTIATNAEDVKSSRPPRVILNDQIIRPFSYEDAVGYKVFRDTDHGKYSKTDQYICHAFISEKYVFIVTDQRVMLSKVQDLVGGWTAEWAYAYAELKEPTRKASTIKLILKQKRKNFLGMSSGSIGKAVKFGNVEIADRVFKRLIDAYKSQ